ncbi:MAG: AAA family ATPase [Magnetococcus sp. THC-1_WYH]
MSQQMTTRRATSTELTGGAGFTYEDTVVAYYLASLLREERAAGSDGIVKSVAVQQGGHGFPMDDIVIEFDNAGSLQRLSLQVKRTVQISASNTHFRDILSRAVTTRASNNFSNDKDSYGFVVEYVATEPFRTLNRLLDWARSSPSGKEFAQRFTPDGAVAAAERDLRNHLLLQIGSLPPDDERNFYAQFVALKLDGLTEGGILRTEVINRLQELVAVNHDGQELLLFDRLCRIVRDGAATACKWTRQTLLSEFRGAIRLNIVPNYRDDIERLKLFSTSGMAEISEEVGGCHVERTALKKEIMDRLAEYRITNLSGLPGCGKSAMLKHIASVYAADGPILFLKSDRLEGKSWLTFATALGLQHHDVAEILTEISAAGTSILFIDGIDHIRPDQKGIIIDVMHSIESNEQLAHWRVLASSRDQGLEPYRSWFPESFYRETGIGDVSIKEFSDEEIEGLARNKPSLKPLLFGSKGIAEIARRPFFAAVLAQNFPDNSTEYLTEIDLISAWWARAGHDAPGDSVPQRQRSLLDLAEKGVRKFGKNISARELKETTVAQVAELKKDLVIRDSNGGAPYSFTHEIFFEWVFFQHLIELGEDWTNAIINAGELPRLGRVVGLLAQNALSTPGEWSVGYRNLENKQSLRPQWQRDWLTAPPFTSAFSQRYLEFQALLIENDFTLLEKLLVWFQAQHTVPNPIILQGVMNEVEGVSRISMADQLGCPSDIKGWGRLLDWLFPLLPDLPVRLLPIILKLFGVWQNKYSNIQNPRSAAMLELCASWLVEVETIKYPSDFNIDRKRWGAIGSEALSNLATNLRMIILCSAHSYPEPAISLFDRAVTNDRMRQEIYNELIGFTSVMADVAPDRVVAVAKAELIKELPQDRLDRKKREDQNRIERLKLLRSIPEENRTEKQKRALEFMPIPSMSYQPDPNDIGIDRHHRYYFPVSPLQEPFATLFSKCPDIAIGLVRDLINHATKGWRQVQLFKRGRMGTPIPLVINFPWGVQKFWGDARVYGWCYGNIDSNPLQCVFQALSYWAFKQVEAGRPTDEVIQAVVEGNECYATLGLALVLALESYTVSETTLPIVTCQRLWHHDIARVVQEPMRNIDLFGFDFLPRLTGNKARAKEFLDSRQSRKREVRELAMRFALSTKGHLQQSFKEALARFPEDLPFEIEEWYSDDGVIASLKEWAERWAGLGDFQNYRKHQIEPGKILVSCEAPLLLTSAQEKHIEETTHRLQEYNVIDWATKSLAANALVNGLSLADAVAFAKDRDSDTILVQRSDAGEHSKQSTISAVAAIVIRFGYHAGPDCDWAWNVMERITSMKEPQDSHHGSKIPWHPANYLINALAHDRRSLSPRQETLRWLFELTLHPIDDVAQLAFKELFMDSDEHTQWVAAQLAMDISLYYQPEINQDGRRDSTPNQRARKQSVICALDRLEKEDDTPLSSVPPAWVELPQKRHYRQLEDEAKWDDANPSFDPNIAAKIFPLFPVETWCQTILYKPLVAAMIQDLVVWTAERLMPSWNKGRHRQGPDLAEASLIEWNHALGDLLARVAPFFDKEFVHDRFLAPFLTEEEEGLTVLAIFADFTVIRHIIDAPLIPANTLELLDDCVERVIRDRCFDQNSRHPGRVNKDLAKMIKALFFVPLEQEEPSASRFANGNWSEISVIIPIVNKLVIATGWSTNIMDNYLTLCERAGTLYPLDSFTCQVNAVLGSLGNAKSSWVGTRLPARIAETVQRLADSNFPLHANHAKELLKVIDSLIDMGDRRSAALEQSEAFRGIQM